VGRAASRNANYHNHTATQIPTKPVWWLYAALWKLYALCMICMWLYVMVHKGGWAARGEGSLNTNCHNHTATQIPTKPVWWLYDAVWKLYARMISMICMWLYVMVHKGGWAARGGEGREMPTTTTTPLHRSLWRLYDGCMLLYETCM